MAAAAGAGQQVQGQQRQEDGGRQPPPRGAAGGNPMRAIYVEKVVLNMGVGRSGDAVEAGRRCLEQISGRKPNLRAARATQRDWGVRKGEPIGVAVTSRGADAVALLKRLLDAKGNSLAGRAFDDRGNFSFGIGEHIDIPGVKYDPRIGILGLDVAVTLARPGYRVKRRSKHRARIGRGHLILRSEAQEYVGGAFGVAVA